MTRDEQSSWSPGSADAELIAAVRNGETAAFGVLYERHAAAARTVARQYMSASGGAEDVVADAFAKVLAVLAGGGGPTTAFRAYLFTVVRRLAYVAVNQSRRVLPTDDASFESVFGPSASSEEPALEKFERSTVARAYKALPERWQAALWYSEVEGLTPAQFAPSLGLTANGAAALAYRAREGLRQQYLQQHLSVVPYADCATTNPLLAGYVRDGLSKRDVALVESHLETCGECRGLLVELGDVSHGMRAIIAPLVLGTVGIGVLGGGLPLWGSAAAAAGSAVSATSALDGAIGTTAGGGVAGGSTTGSSTTGSSTAGATSTGGAATGSSAGAASGAGATGLGAVLAGVPTLIVGAAAVVVVGAGVAVAAALGVFSEESDTTAQPSSAAPSADPVPGTGQQPSVGDPSTDPTTPANTLLPTPAPTAAGSGGTGGAATTPAPSATGATRTAGPGSVAAAPFDPTPSPTAAPTPGPTSPPTTEPTTGPTTDPKPDPSPLPTSPPELQMSFSSGPGIVARQNNTVAFSLSNTGETAATDVAVSLAVPGTLRFIAESSTSAGPFGPRLLRTAAEGWSCASSGPPGEPQVVRCVVDEIAPGAEITLALTFYAEDAVTADLAAQIFVGRDPVGDPWPFTSPVSAAPARLTAAVAPVADLVAGQPGYLALTVANEGQLTAIDPEVTLSLPADSGLSWRVDPAIDAPTDSQSATSHGGVPPRTARAPTASLTPAPGSTPGWVCSVSSDGLACAGPQVDGDRSATVIVPVDVASDSAFAGTVRPATTFAGAPIAAPAAVPSALSVVRDGLSAASILDGPLQVAHVAGPLGEPLRLTLPDGLAAPEGTTVRQALLTWSGQDTQGLGVLSTVELRTDAGGFAREQVAGRAIVVPPAGDETSSYWGTADVTALVAAHPQTGRWFLAPAEGTSLPADLTWSLTVVYEHAGLPSATVTLLVGAPGPDLLLPATETDPAPSAGAQDAAEPRLRPLVLPAEGPVRVAATGTARGAPTDGVLTVNGTGLAPVAGDLPGVVTYRSDDLLAAAPGAHGPLALSVDPGSSAFAVLAVHSSTAGDRPGPDLSGVLDQPQASPTDPVLSVEVTQTAQIGDGTDLPVTVRNDSAVDLADVSVAFDLPAGVTATAPLDPACRTAAMDSASPAHGSTPSPETVTCSVGDLAAAESVVVTLSLAGVDGLVLTGEVAYTVAGSDPVTGTPAATSGTVAVTGHRGVTVRGTWTGSVAVTEVGAPLMRCAPVSCWLVDSPWWADATNDLLSMRPLNDADGETTSSSATVALPEGATVTHAGLYWSANRKAGEDFSQDLSTARLRAPGAATYTPIAGEVLGEVSDSSGRVSYQSYADVTELVAAHGAGEWSVADVALATLSYGSGWDSVIASRDLYAGWSLVVVYEDAALPAGSVTVLDSPVAVTKTSGLSVDVLGEASMAATLGVVAWEGDRRVTGDQLLVNSVALRPLLSPGAAGHAPLGSASDAFSSVAWGSTTRYENSLGVDAKKFESTQMAPGANTISAVTTGDEYVVGVVTITTR